MARRPRGGQHPCMTMTPATSQSAAHKAPTPKYVLTAQRAEALRAELVRLREQKEREISEQLREARAFGDAADNDEYLAIREEELVLDARIASLEEILGRASVVDGGGLEPGVVAIGSTVTVADAGTKSIERYRIVGMHERHRAGDVSAGAPVGQALLGRHRGETTTVTLPNGRERRLRIVATEH